MFPFETRKRADGTEFVTLRDDAPEELLKAVRDAHCGALPSDWVSEICADSWASIEAGGITDEDSIDDWADDRITWISSPDILRWYADHAETLYGQEYTAEAAEMIGTEPMNAANVLKFAATTLFCGYRAIAHYMRNVAS